MFRALILFPLLLLAPKTHQTPAADAPGSPPSGYHQVKLNGHTFTLPVGFTIELAAGPPLADRPIVAALDEKGRLYVCDSSGSNEKVTEQMKKKPHRIMRLEDTDGDGKYDKSTVYVANVMFPEGAMWLNGSLYVAAVPHILKFTDTDDDGKADKEEIWFDGEKVSKTVGGCANDLHGPYLGPDGWIYWCKGGFEKQEYEIRGKKFVSKAAHIFRARPDGTGIEPVMTGGMDNPVDVVFTPSGERIFSCTFLQNPANGKRDGLIHAVYGAVYGKDHAPVYDHPWTSPHLMEPMTHLGPAAPCGLHRYESDQFGKDYENNLFCCQFNLRKVSRHVLVPSGSTFITKDSDFVVSDQHDFHPTDVIEDADGSLLILDTGGWYKLCCPSSQLVKPDVKGAIYRVKKVGSHNVADPRGEKIEWGKLKAEELVKLLDDPRPVVWWKSIDKLALEANLHILTGLSEHPPLLAEIAIKASKRQRLAAVWSICRTKSDWPTKSTYFSADSDPTVRQAALHVASLLREKDGWGAALEHLAENTSFTQRHAAEIFGRIGFEKGVEYSIKVLARDEKDPILDHSLTYALIEIDNPKETTKWLSHESPRVRRAVLTALDQMPSGNLDAKYVLAELNSPDASLRETAWWIAGRHPEWGGQLVQYFKQQLGRASNLNAAEREELTDRLAKFAKNEAVQHLLSKDPQPIALKAMARAGLKETPAEWLDALAALIAKGGPETPEAIRTARALPQPKTEHAKLTEALLKFAEDDKHEDDLRLIAAAALHPKVPHLDGKIYTLAIESLEKDHSAAERSAATDALTRCNFTEPQLIGLAVALKKCSPLDLAKLFPVYAKSTDAQVGLIFVRELGDPAVLPAVRLEVVKPILDKYPAAVKAEAEKLYGKLAEARKDDTAKLERLLKDLPTGDVRRGQAVFNGAKAQCAACHKIGYVGGLVGPDLTRIGGIRTERDLLESIVFPSASFVRSYEPVRVVTADGRTLSGILKKDAPDEIILTVAADKEERIARADVESISPGTVSVMPDGLDKQVTAQELADLVAFLRACK